MAAAFHSSDLQWQLLRANHSFLVKRGPTAVFSAEPLNITNTHSYKFSGLGQITQRKYRQDKEGTSGRRCAHVCRFSVCAVCPHRPPASSAAAAAVRCSRLVLLRLAAVLLPTTTGTAASSLLQLTLALSV
jgi:hypothetical protein